MLAQKAGLGGCRLKSFAIREALKGLFSTRSLRLLPAGPFVQVGLLVPLRIPRSGFSALRMGFCGKLCSYSVNIARVLDSKTREVRRKSCALLFPSSVRASRGGRGEDFGEAPVKGAKSILGMYLSDSLQI